jgi:hypothetical protein
MRCESRSLTSAEPSGKNATPHGTATFEAITAALPTVTGAADPVPVIGVELAEALAPVAADEVGDGLPRLPLQPARSAKVTSTDATPNARGHDFTTGQRTDANSSGPDAGAREPVRRLVVGGGEEAADHLLDFIQ